MTSTGKKLYNGKIVDWVTLGGISLPAPAILASAPKIVSKWEERGGVGLLGAWPFYNGQGLAEFSLSFLMWDADSVDEFDVYADLDGPDPLFKVGFQRSKNGKIIGATPLDIVYPAVNHLGIRSCVVKEQGTYEKKRGGEMTYTVSFLQFNPPPKVNVSKRADGSVDGKKNVPPKNEVQTQIEELLKEKDQAEAEQARLDAE